MAKLKELYVFVMEGPLPEDEGIINFQAYNNMDEILWLPLATHRAEDLERFRPLAQGIGAQLNRNIKLVKFTSREDL
jgi:hypothetical protein